MTRTLIVAAAFLILALPTALAAPPADKPGKSAAAPGQSAEKAAQKAAKKARKQLCKSLRKTDPAAYRAQCKKPKDESAAQEAREENAAEKCRAEREAGLEAFKQKYAPVGHPNGANAFGKCVSKLSKEKNDTD